MPALLARVEKKMPEIHPRPEATAAAIDLIVQQARLRDGSRKIVQITKVQGMEGDTVVLG